jgi:hypothetical protein
VDAREPPSQLQEALKESAKADVEYNFPTLGEQSGNIQGTSREHPGNIQGTFREHSGHIQRIFRESGNVNMAAPANHPWDKHTRKRQFFYFILFYTNL